MIISLLLLIDIACSHSNLMLCTEIGDFPPFRCRWVILVIEGLTAYAGYR